jgi:trigger factor
MQASLENISSLERRLSVTMPLDEVNAEVASRLKHLAKTAKLHGFRPGKVPMRIVEQQYGGQVRQEVMGDAVQKSFGDAVREKNLRVAGYPRIELKSAEGDAGKFEYVATFEIYPEVSVGDLSSAVVEQPKVDIGDEQVDKTIEILRKQRATFEAVDRAATPGDQVQMNYQGSIDGEAFEGGSGEGVSVQLGEGRLLPDFESNVSGLKAGESKTFELRFPDDYHGKAVAGKTASFDVSVAGVLGPKLPELDADFAKSLGIADGDLAKMRAEVKANIEREVKRRALARVKERAMKVLLDATAVELPKALIDLEVERLTHNMRHDLESRGMKADQIPLPREAFEEEAKRRVQLGLIIAEVVRKNGLGAKADQIKALVEEFSRSYEKPEEVVRWYYQTPERLREVESIVLEDNVVQWVLGQAKVEDKATAFDDLMGEGK